MSSDQPPVLKDIDWALYEDGKALRLTFKATTGEQIVSEMTAESLAGFMSLLVEISIESGRRSAPEDVSGRQVYAKPIPISQIGFGAGRDPTELTLALRTGILEFLFAVDASTLLETLRSLEAIARPQPKPSRN
jgi:hypothetical protein